MKKAFILLLFISQVIVAQPIGPTGSWDLAFEDNFDGKALDLKKWNYNYTWGRTHNHRAYMVDSMVTVKDGFLSLKAKRERNPAAPDGTNKWESSFGYIPFDFTSGAINTNGKFNFTCGYAEARLKIPATLGTWPAFWTLNANGAWPPEIDILEVPGDRKTHHYYYHYGPDSQHEASFGATHTGVDKSLDYHTYGVEWGGDYMKFYFDGKLVNSYTGRSNAAQGTNMYLILNLAVGGWAPAPAANALFPAYYTADWVRVWKRRTPVASNFNFETGQLDPWGAWNNSSVTADCKRNGAFGIKNTGSPASIEQTVSVLPNTSYVFGGYAKVNSGSEQIMFGVKNYGGNQLTKLISGTAFTRDSVIFKTGASSTSATLFFYKSEGTGSACGDDFFLHKAEVLTALNTESEIQLQWTCFPNPFTNQFEISGGHHFYYSIFNGKGELVEKGSGHSSLITGQTLPSGIYFIKLNNDFNQRIFRLSKN